MKRLDSRCTQGLFHRLNCGMKWIQLYDVPGTADDDLTYYLTESHRLVSLGLTKKKQKELGLNQD
ncbi:MAG TPA: hypothetical protein DCW52_02775 [Gammaproteobacteria bacterium]|nr:hypothetical protein [Gammaproteobacteria bacterium]